MPIKLNGATSGSVELDVPDAVGSDLQVTLPATAGEIVVKDSSGRVGIGTSSPALKLHVEDSSAQIIRFGRTGIGAGSLDIDSSGNTVLNAHTTGQAVAFHTQTIERLRIDNSGRLLAGTSSWPDNDKFVLRGNSADDNEAFLSLVRGSAPANNQNLGMILFHGNGAQTESARITALRDGGTWTPGSSHPGRLVFSTTANGASYPTERMRIAQDGRMDSFSSSPSNGFVWTVAGGSSGNNLFLLRNSSTGYGTGTSCLAITMSGNVYNTNNSYGAISDVKLKENIVDASSQWDDLKALQVRNYNFKEGQTHTQIGLVAQEAELVSPGLVSESPDRDEDGNDLGTVTKSINYSVLYMKAVKALQEAMGRIETLETKVAALEATS